MGVQHLNPGKELYCLGGKEEGREEGRERGGGTEGGRERGGKEGKEDARPDKHLIQADSTAIRMSLGLLPQTVQ